MIRPQATVMPRTLPAVLDEPRTRFDLLRADAAADRKATLQTAGKTRCPHHASGTVKTPAGGAQLAVGTLIAHFDTKPLRTSDISK